MGDPYTLLPHALPSQLRLKQPSLCDGGVFDKISRSSLPLGDLLRHVEVAPMVGAVWVKRQFDPLLAKGHIHPLSMSQNKQTTWSCRGERRGTFFLRGAAPIRYVVRLVPGLAALLHFSIELLHMLSVWQQTSSVIV